MYSEREYAQFISVFFVFHHGYLPSHPVVVVMEVRKLFKPTYRRLPFCLYTTDSKQEDKVTIYKKTSSTTRRWSADLLWDMKINDLRYLAVGYWEPSFNAYMIVLENPQYEDSRVFRFNISGSGVLTGTHYVRGCDWLTVPVDLHDTSHRYEPGEWSDFVTGPRSEFGRKAGEGTGP